METIKGFKDEELRSVYLGILENQPKPYQARLTAFVTMQQKIAVRDYKKKVQIAFKKIDTCLCLSCKDRRRILLKELGL